MILCNGRRSAARRMQSGRWERISKKRRRQNSWVSSGSLFSFFFFPCPPDAQRVNPSAFVSRCVASALAACPSCVLTPQLDRTVTLGHKKAGKARRVNASCLRPRSLEPVQPTMHFTANTLRELQREQTILFIIYSHNITNLWHHCNLGIS